MEYYDTFRKTFEPEAFQLADFVENYDNSKKKLDWGDVNNEGLDYLGIKGIEKRNKIFEELKLLTENEIVKNSLNY